MTTIATIVDRRPETPDTSTYHLDWRDSHDRFAFIPGQFMDSTSGLVYNWTRWYMPMAAPNPIRCTPDAR